MAKLPDNFDSEEFTPPPLDPILAYRGVHVLCTTNKNGAVLKANYYASCLVMGRQPIWGMWTVGGRFLRFYGSRSEIAADYSRLVWRRKMARFSLESLRNHSIALRRDQLKDEYRKPLPKQENAA